MKAQQYNKIKLCSDVNEHTDFSSDIEGRFKRVYVVSSGGGLLRIKTKLSQNTVREITVTDGWDSGPLEITAVVAGTTASKIQIFT